MTIKEILERYKTVAVVGFSEKPHRDSNKIALFLKSKGYKVLGVNPELNGQNISGIDCFDSLSNLKEKIDIVDVFRKSEFLPEIVNEVLKMKYKPAVFWAQLGISNSDAEKIALENNIEYIENKCILVEYNKLI